ncbi:hypothetical protein SMSK321_1674 [Streptococcus mitis SK321]|nr:hypothetical protein SMSK321_1674 [Streptococcus mitis SK321]
MNAGADMKKSKRRKILVRNGLEQKIILSNFFVLQWNK